MRFVVTGGAGFIGSHLTKLLVNSGYSVDVVDNMHRGNLANLREVINKIKLHQIDILDFAAIKELVKGTDGIFHQAALTSVIESYAQKIGRAHV